MTTTSELRVITTKVPARLDQLPWAVRESRARHLPDDRYAPPDRPGKPGGASGSHRNRSA
ncbi:hypothetical protein [Streptomyces avermitilis]|uniref:hypothetical protein n=1 Tax=Streptomyces avermitilis TaxID=33903 RepID=UPI0033AEE0A6